MLWPSKEQLDKIDISFILNRFPDTEYHKQYISRPASDHHYRLLTWLSSYFNNTILIEIGVWKGASGLSLSQNPSNKVIGFDVEYQITADLPSNYTLIIGDVLKNEHLIKSSPFLFYDTMHDGVLENEFLCWLQKINYSGLILFDDIYLNKNMNDFWESIIFKKEDITYLGHYTGSGVVWM